MNITIIGYGNMGSGLAARAVKAGHTVKLAGHNPARASEAAAKVGAKAAALSDSTGNADIVILATPYPAAAEALAAAGNLAGKVLIDISNPLKADFSGLTLGFNTSAAEEIQKLVPTAKVVKAFNTVFAQIFSEGPDFGAAGKVSVLIAGDDEAAKQSVQQFAESLGFATIQAGGLANARYLEPLGMLNIALGYGLGQGTAIAPTWIHRD